jgi:hypothetical protein
MSKKRKGWICPLCGTGINPDMTYCDCTSSVPGEPTKSPTAPVQPYLWNAYQCPTCNTWIWPHMTHICGGGTWTTTNSA